MKKALSKPTFAPPEYSYQDPFSSFLQSMQNSCAQTLRPTWSFQDLNDTVRSTEDYQQHFKQLSDLDIIGFEDKCLENDTWGNDIILNFTPFLTNSELDQKSQLEFPENLMDFKPEILPVKDLQILKPVLWGDLTYDENIPTMSFYEDVQKISPHPLQYDDPLKMSPSPLLPTMSSENFAPQISLAPASLKMSAKNFTYPATPPFDYLVDTLASQVENLSIVQYLKSETRTHIMPQGETDRKQSSEIQRETSPVNLRQFRSPINTIAEMDLTSKDQSSDVEQVTYEIEHITVEFSSFAIRAVQMMENHISACLNNLKCSNLPVIADLFGFPSITELQPTTTRLCLLNLKEEISKSKLDPSRAPVEKDLEKILPTLLSLHGVNKALDIFLNIEYDLAYEALADFRNTHEAILRAGDYKNLLFRLLRLRPENREELHPKILEVKAIVLRQLKEDNTNRKIWIRLYRHSNDVAARIHHLLAEAGVLCEVDPQIVNPQSVKPFLPSGNYPVIVAERTPKDFPPSMLSLIIHYEWPCKSTMETNKQFANIAQKAIVVNRPARLEELQNNSAQEAIQISAPISTSVSDQNLLVLNPSSPSVFIKDGKTAALQNESAMHHKKQSLIETQVEVHASADAESVAESCARSEHFVEEQLTEECVKSTNNNTSNETVPASVVEKDIDQNPPEGFVAHLPIVLSAAMMKNIELMEAFHDIASNLTIHECDYGYLDVCEKYQPDVLVSLDTALLIVHEEENFEEIRLKILITSFKCTKCWVLVLAPGVLKSSKPPQHWHSLAGLTRFYEKKDRGPTETRFLLKPRLAVTYNHVAFMIKDIVEDEASADIESHLHPLTNEAKLLLNYPQFNAVSASLITEHFSPQEIFTLPIETLCSRLPTLRKIIKIFRRSQKLNNEQQAATRVYEEENSSFGIIKPVWRPQTESEAFHSPKKRVKLDANHPEDFDTPYKVSQLRDMWSSPFVSDHPQK